MHLITITTEERKKDLTEIFLNTSNVIIICKVQTEIQSSRLISNKGAKKTPEAKLRGSQTYEGLWAVTFIHLPDGTHDTTLCSPWSWSLWWWRLHNSQAIYCLSLFSVARSSFLSNSTNEVTPTASSLIHQQKEQTTPLLQCEDFIRFWRSTSLFSPIT